MNKYKQQNMGAPMTMREYDTSLPNRTELNSSPNQASDLDLVTILAHDLRNYITPVYGQVGKIQKRAEAEGRDGDVWLAKNSIRVLDQMVVLITNVLDLARTERGILDLSLVPVDVCGLAHQMASLLASDRHAITVNAPPYLVVRADGERLRQALHNLLANALHYSPQGKPVEMSISTRTDADKTLAVITVRDHGTGIPPEFMLFQQFTPGPNSTGLGIGLCMTQQIAIAHGGNLTLRAVEGPGACFELIIPAQERT